MRTTLAAGLVLLAALPARAAQIGDLSESSIWQQLLRFLSFSDPSLRYALLGSLLLGVSCGLLGSYIVLRRLSLMGDTLGHSVLPGVVIAFMLTGQKDVFVLLVGAAVAGGLASLSVWAVTRFTPLREDAAMGIVLSTFFAVGIAGLTALQKWGSANQSGLDKFLFGQAAALGREDLVALAIAAAASVMFVVLLYKELLVSSFDPIFARTAGMPVDSLHLALMGLVTFAIVAAIQAVGVILVSAMLIIPAATAHLLTDRMHTFLWISALVGAGSGALGTFFSFLGSSLPTGPCMVLAATTFFSVAWLGAPRHGWIARRLQHRRRQARVAQENMLKAVYQVMESQGMEPAVSLDALALRRHRSSPEVRAQLAGLERRGLCQVDGDLLELTPAGRREAERIVRNHRLWELFLTNQADIAPDHVHRDAEEIEHFLSPGLVARLEEALGHPTADPHGSPIPARGDS
ncbi:MAG: metal ABC transporter permease [Armatimonadetes bacterium]|nr:metal ABC transporter permease [Armatimonadota bacterium]